MNFGRAIRLCRIQRDISQEVLAKLSGTSGPHISLIERNKRDPSLSAVCRIASVLEVPLYVLMFLAADEEELSESNPELLEKLSYAFLKPCSKPSENVNELKRKVTFYENR